MHLPSTVFIVSVVTYVSVETVGGYIFSYLRYLFFLIPFSQLFPFMFPHCFSSIIFIASKAIFLSSGVKSLGLLGLKKVFLGISPSFHCYTILTHVLFIYHKTFSYSLCTRLCEDEFYCSGLLIICLLFF